MCVTKDPDTGIQNVAMLRMQIQDRNRTARPSRRGIPGCITRNMKQENEPMPMAAVIGHHPVLDLATNSSVPYGVDEFQVAGSLLQEPLGMVQCETRPHGPAHAEIVIEGVIPPASARRGSFRRVSVLLPNPNTQVPRLRRKSHHHAA